MFEIYCKRDPKSYKGWLSFIVRDKNGGVVEHISGRDIPILTGVKGYFEKSFDWVRGKGGIPEGNFFVWTTNIKQKDELNPTGKQIGEAYHVSSTKEDLLTVTNPKTGAIREAIMIHPDNSFPGSLGCIVFPNTKNGRDSFKLFRQFIQLARYENVKHIPLKVWR